ncbi:MAG: hypothetical protein ACJ74L_02490 [Gaiellaceae bacterium]
MLYLMGRVSPVALLAALAIATAASAATTAKPTLQLVSSKPLIVRGANFKPQEHVRLTMRTGEDVTYRRANASRRGMFRSDFGTVTFGRCGGFTIRAVGSMGSSVLFKKLPLPACMPERSP